MNPATLESFLLHGLSEAPPPRRPLRAGPLALHFDAGDLRYVRLGGREVIRRIYAAVRDRNWGTVPGVLSGLRVDVEVDAFEISYCSTHRAGEIDFVWRAEISGNAEGVIRFHFDGEARSDFLRNRIGCCVLHPIHECAGAPCRTLDSAGVTRVLRFPESVAREQPVAGLHDLAGLAHEVEPGLWAELRFSGDVFETEDQRNWIDASFKTFCTPLRLPFPVQIWAGTRVRQEITLRLVSASRWLPSSAPSGEGATITASGPPAAGGFIEIASERGAGAHRLPSIGLGTASHDAPLSAGEAVRLRALRAAHLRVDVRAWEVADEVRLERAAASAAALECPLELALHLDPAPAGPSPALREILAARRVAVARVLVFQRHQKSTTSEALAVARDWVECCFGRVPLGAGSDADLYQIQLQRPPGEADFICWSMNPQVHAFDNASIAETPEAVPQQLASMRRQFPGRPLVISPVTLKPRFNPVATGPALPVPAGELPPQVDSRQLSLFGAAWTLAMLRALTAGGAASVTFFETTGWRGVMETHAGSAVPDRFPSAPGAVFPLYHVLADAGEFAGGDVLETRVDDALTVAALHLQHAGRERLILANLQPAACLVKLRHFGRVLGVRRLNIPSGHVAITAPEAFRAAFAPWSGDSIELAPHELITMELAYD